MWQSYSTDLLDSLQKIGINASQVSGRSPQIPARLIEHNLRWYSESIAPEYYSAYHIWRPDRPYNWGASQSKKNYTSRNLAIKKLSSATLPSKILSGVRPFTTASSKRRRLSHPIDPTSIAWPTKLASVIWQAFGTLTSLISPLFPCDAGFIRSTEPSRH